MLKISMMPGKLPWRVSKVWKPQSRQKKWRGGLAWEITYQTTAWKTLSKLDKQIAQRITRFMQERIAPLENPRSVGEALTGNELGDYWKYRVGDYRIVVEIEDKVLRIVVVKLGNRRDVYR